MIDKQKALNNHLGFFYLENFFSQ